MTIIKGQNAVHWCLRRAATALSSLRICEDSTKLSLLAYTKYESEEDLDQSKTSRFTTYIDKDS